MSQYTGKAALAPLPSGSIRNTPSLDPGDAARIAEQLAACRHDLFAPQPNWQSPSRSQLPSGAHGAQLPPQSMSVSLPFLMPSLQLAAEQTSPVQTPLWQSAGVTQRCPCAQRSGQLAPQSTSLSCPLRMASPQVAVPSDERPTAPQPSVVEQTHRRIVNARVPMVPLPLVRWRMWRLPGEATDLRFHDSQKLVARAGAHRLLDRREITEEIAAPRSRSRAAVVDALVTVRGSHRTVDRPA